MKINFLFVLALFSMQFLKCQTTHYVSVSGSNSNTGLIESNAYSTIQFAIDQSANGDSVIVLPGTYVENIIYNGKSIVISSLFSRTQDTTFISSTIIDGGANGVPVVRFENGESNSSQLLGITIQNGLIISVEKGAGVNINGGPTLENCIIKNNHNLLGTGGAIQIIGSGTTLINSCEIIGNTSTDYAGGIYAGGGTKFTISKSRFINNTRSAIRIFPDTYNTGQTISNCVFIGNSEETILVGGKDLVFINCTFFNNHNSNFSLGGNSALINCIVSKNHTISNSGILKIHNSIIEDGTSSISTSLPTLLTLSNVLEVDPVFHDENLMDLRLKNYSPAVGYGINSVNVFGYTFSSPAYDIMGMPRPNPIGSNPDIGAYENVLGVQVNAPPTVQSIANVSMYEDIPLTVTLTELSDGNLNETQNLSISAVSSNQTLLPNPIANYTQGQTTAALTFSPVFNAFGQSTITVIIKDDGGIANGGLDSTVISFIVTVNPMNDTPNELSIDNSTIYENAVGLIGTFTTIDIDPMDNFNYTLVSGAGDTDNALFYVSANQLMNVSAFDFESQNTFSIRVRTTDDSLVMFEKIFTIQVFNVNDIQITELITNTICAGSIMSGAIAVTVDQFNGNLNYSWSGPNGFTSTDQNISGLDAGNYTVTVTDDFDSQSTTFTVGILPVYGGLEVCYVSSDLNDPTKNRVFFKNPGMYNIEYYQVLRESSVVGVYDLIGQANAIVSSFLDNSSDNSSLSYKYEVRSVDSCGNFSTESPFHRTILLQANLGLGNTVNLSWNPYEGTAYTTYSVFRSVNGGPFELLISLPTSNTTFNDGAADVSINTYKYFVGIAINACDFTKTNNQIRSNQKIIGNALVSEIQEDQINIYPNPVNDILIVSIPDIFEMNYIDLLDQTGKLVGRFNSEFIQVTGLQSGTYLIKIVLSSGQIIQKMITRI